jgi:hypothetical protein
MRDCKPGEQTRQREIRNPDKPVAAWPFADLPISSHLAHQNQMEDLFKSVTPRTGFRETHFLA